MIACLPMYDRPELLCATDALWASISNHLRNFGIKVPNRLTRSPNYEDFWESPDLIFGMTCGQPYRDRLHGRVFLIGTFDYALPNCPPGYYQSHIIVRKGDSREKISDLHGAKFAYNSVNSESGYCCVLRLHENLKSFCGDLIETGAHDYSIIKVFEGSADFAAIDAVTWRYFKRSNPEIASKIKIIQSTDPVPGLPLITYKKKFVPNITKAVELALIGSPEIKNALQIKEFVKIPPDHYIQ